MNKSIWGLLLGSVLAVFLVGCAAPTKSDQAASVTESSEEAHDHEKAEQEAEEAKTKAKASADHLECGLGEDQRVIHVERSESGSCEVHYTKHGESEVVATASADMNYCDQIRDRIQGNLTTAGFTCQ